MATKAFAREELQQLYIRDYPLWVDINLELLREKAYDLVDWENLLEEIQDMGQRHLDACISYLAVILEHMYKFDNWKHLAGGDNAGKTWIRSIENSRTNLRILLEEYPSLQVKLPAELERSWKRATGKLEIWLRNNDYEPKKFYIPVKCPYTYEEALNREF